MPRTKIRNKAVEQTKVDLTEDEEIELLKERIASNIPERGSQLTGDGLTFADFALSKKTMEGLVKAGISVPTDIQAAALPHALCGRDVLGAAKTGSGKTLSFVIPVLELLYRERWGLGDGLAAIIITPTRELALQIFDVLRTTGRKHQISAGLVTGGKKEFEEEQERIVKMNILVATPGRLLQHFEQTPGFDCSNLLALVLDEADRILDMGFKHQLDSIVSYLPHARQTMLFSATQTKSVKDLARLSLKQPEFLAVHAAHAEATPSQLKQNYIVCPLHQKLDVLFSFIKTHLKSKIIVFLSSCSQVRFVHECFRGMQPGIPLTALHGKIKQDRRTVIYMDFLRRKFSCLFATDVAARGLDFPDVDWVIQVDAPEDSAMYIHRVGRTARYKSGGRALLMVMPSEEKLVSAELEEAGVPIKRLSMNPNKSVSVASRAAALLISNPDCRSLAKKYFTSYLKSVQLLARNKGNILQGVDTNSFAASLGLAVPPAVPLVATSAGSGEDSTHKVKNVNRSLDRLKKQIKAAKEEKRLAAQGMKPLPLTDKKGNDTSESDSEEEFFVAKNAGMVEDLETAAGDVTVHIDAPAVGAKAKKVKPLKIRQDGESTASVRAGAKRIAFDDSGKAVDPLERIAGMTTNTSTVDSAILQSDISDHIQKTRRAIDAVRREDNARERERVKEKHLKKKRRVNDEDNGQAGVGGDQIGTGGAFLMNAVEEDDGSDSDASCSGSDRQGQQQPDSDIDSSGDDYEGSSESEDDMMASKYAVGKKRKDMSSASDDVRQQEELALKLLMGKS